MYINLSIDLSIITIIIEIFYVTILEIELIGLATLASESHRYVFGTGQSVFRNDIQ